MDTPHLAFGSINNGSLNTVEAYWFTAENDLHRDDGPAVVVFDRYAVNILSIRWFLNGYSYTFDEWTCNSYWFKGQPKELMMFIKLQGGDYFKERELKEDYAKNKIYRKLKY